VILAEQKGAEYEIAEAMGSRMLLQRCDNYHRLRTL